MTAKEYNILLKLVDNANHIVTIGTLCQTACGEMWQGYETTLMTHIRHLREKIEKNPSSPVSLLTVKGLGYKLLVNPYYIDFIFCTKYYFNMWDFTHGME